MLSRSRTERTCFSRLQLQADRERSGTHCGICSCSMAVLLRSKTDSEREAAARRSSSGATRSAFTPVQPAAGSGELRMRAGPEHPVACRCHAHAEARLGMRA